MHIVSWNLNGLLSCLKHNSFAQLEALQPDIICCQEIRTNQRPHILDGYEHYWHPSERGGYSGTLIMTRQPPKRVIYGFTDSWVDTEGRVLTAEYPGFILVNLYIPNSSKSLRRGKFRLDWEDEMIQHLYDERGKRAVIVCGDFNAPRLAIDVYPENLREQEAQRGYLSDERASLETMLEVGFVDAFRHLYPDREGAYTWWSNRLNKRLENRGWRLDYFFVDEDIAHRIVDVRHHTEIVGSDHCPIELEIAL